MFSNKFFLVATFFLSQKNINSQIFFSYKNFLVRKILVTKNFNHKICFSHKFFLSQIFLVTKKIKSQKFFSHKKILVTKKI